MSTTHSCIAEIFTGQLSPIAVDDEENSVERGRRAQAEAWSLRRMLVTGLDRLFARMARRNTEDLEAAVHRLSELSPHLLADVGIDPETGALMEETDVPVIYRPARAAMVLPQEAPATAVKPRRAARVGRPIRVLPEVGDTAVTQPA